jgi:transcriptional regulator with XRE-family HTH domain
MPPKVGYPTLRCQGFLWDAPPRRQRDVQTLVMHNTAEKLLGLRKARNINQADAAAAANISRPHLSKVENGHDPASLEVLVLLAAFYRVPMSELLSAGHPLARVEIVTQSDELAWLRLFRSLPVEQANALLAALATKQAA